MLNKKNILVSFFIFCTVFSLANPNYRIKKIVIDAGHGGKDPGCHGTIAKEKDVCLSIALNLGKYISENYHDIEVVFTRKTDVFLELHERAKVANDSKADLFICIHANSGPSSVFGTETYVMGLHKTEANLEVAKRENSSILMEDNYKLQYEGFDPNSDESYIALSLLQGTYLEQSLNFASKIQKQITKIERTDRGVKQAGFLVLYRTAMPSILIETGFLTNKDEEKFLADSANREKTAFTIFEAFKEYKNEMEKSIKNEIHEKQADAKITKWDNDFNDQNTNNKQQATNNKQQIIFKVQIASSAKKLPLNSEKFRDMEFLTEYADETTFKYAVGNEKTPEEATALLKKIKGKGHTDAFVVAFYKEKRITLAEAKKILEINRQ